MRGITNVAGGVIGTRSNGPAVLKCSNEKCDNQGYENFSNLGPGNPPSVEPPNECKHDYPNPNFCIYCLKAKPIELICWCGHLKDPNHSEFSKDSGQFVCAVAGCDCIRFVPALVLKEAVDLLKSCVEKDPNKCDDCSYGSKECEIHKFLRVNGLS